MKRSLWLLALLALPFASACEDDPPEVRIESFSRPTDLTFSCFDAMNRVFVARGLCEGDDARFRLTALVVQTGRGELAAVDLDGGTILDIDRRVPGFTFRPVGEVPVAVVVPDADPSTTYVANFASRTITALETESVHPLGDRAGRDPVDTPLPGAPTSLVLSADERFLIAGLPDQGALAQIPITGGGLGTPTLIPLSVESALGVDLRELESPPDPTAYEKVCVEVEFREPAATLAPREPLSLADTPRPAEMVVDAETSRLLVADEALPLIHVFDLGPDGAVEAAPIHTGSPVRSMALTPVVPLNADGSGQARYLYAVDATDLSMMVIDVTEGAPSFGAVLPISAEPGLEDRISFAPGVRSITILSPGYPEGTICDGSDSQVEENAAPRNLRGVFAAAALSNGVVVIFDIYDLDAGCRGGQSCDGGLNGEDGRVFIRRHRPRLASFVTSEASLQGVPTMAVDSARFRLAADGDTDGTTAPRLEPIPGGCPRFLSQIYPRAMDGEAVVCTLDDPWQGRAERWTAQWEGVLPRASGGRGRIVGDRFAVSDNRFCAAGVVGGDDESGPEDAAYPGDVLIVTAPVPPGREDTAACSGFGDPEERDEIGFRIRETFQQELVLEATSVDGQVALADVATCFDELMTYSVRVADRYLVTGQTTGFVHAVAPDEDGRCGYAGAELSEIEADPAASGWSRLAAGETFVSATMAFTMGFLDNMRTIPVEPGSSVELDIVIGSLPPLLAHDIAEVPTVPARVRFSPIDDRLYVVDSAAIGVVQLALDEFGAVRNFE